MPWEEVSTMSLRLEFVRFALHEDANMSELCRGFGISRKTGYKWLYRYQQHGKESLMDQSSSSTAELITSQSYMTGT